MAKINKKFMDGYKRIVNLIEDCIDMPNVWFANEINHNVAEFNYWLNKDNLELAEWYRGRVAALTNLEALATIDVVGASKD